MPKYRVVYTENKKTQYWKWIYDKDAAIAMRDIFITRWHIPAHVEDENGNVVTG